MKRAILLAACALSLGGCVSRAIAERECHKTLGPTPDRLLGILGPIGDLAAYSDPARVSFDQKMEACVQQQMAVRN